MAPYILILLDIVPIFFISKEFYFLFLSFFTSAAYLLNCFCLKSSLLFIFIVWGFLSGVLICWRYEPTDNGFLIKLEQNGNFQRITALEGKMCSDSRRIKGGRYLCDFALEKIMMGNIESTVHQNITVFVTGNKLYWGDKVRLEKLRLGRDGTTVSAGKSLFLSSSFFFTVRKYAVEAFSEKIYYVFDRGGYLAEALFTGNRDNLPSEFRDMFRKSGLAHVLALSGMHLGIIALFVFFIVRKFTTPAISMMVVNIVNILYLLLAGLSPSLFRSVIMFFLISLAKISGSRINMMKILFFSFSISLMIFPEYFFSMSFQLSFLALGGIIFLTSNLSAHMEKFIPVSIAGGIACSLAAVIGRAPVSLYNFGIIYPVGIISSVVISPIVTFYMCSGLAVMLFPIGFLRLISPFINGFFNSIYFLIQKCVEFFSLFPGISIVENIPFCVLLFFQLTVIVIIYFPWHFTRVFRRFR